MISMKQLRIKKDTALKTFWINYNTLILKISIALMSIAAIVWLGYEFWRFFWEPDFLGSREVRLGAIDLKLRYREVACWFSGKPLYELTRVSTYPPASYVMFWPFVGWLNMASAKGLWIITTAASLGWLIYIIIKESGAKTSLERFFVALIPLSMYATGATIGNGQLVIHILPLLVFGLLLMNRGKRKWKTDLLAALLLLAGLVKPNISVPFFWIMIFIPGRTRPAMLVILGYIILTFFASLFQDAGTIHLFMDWAKSSSISIERVGVANVNFFISAITRGKEFQFSVIALIILGLWIYYHRNVDLWVLIGVAAIVSRFWTYHLWYDDLVVLLPIVALYRIAKNKAFKNGFDIMAGFLLGITLIFMMAPGGLYLFPNPWNLAYVFIQTIILIAVLIFLISIAWKEKAQQNHNESDILDIHFI